MGWFDVWIQEWRDTYDAYPVATVVTWGELLAAVGLLVFSFVYMAVATRAPTWMGVALLSVGTAFAVWFTVLRRPLMDRLVGE